MGAEACERYAGLDSLRACCTGGGRCVAHSFPMFFTADGRIVSGATREHGIGITMEELQAVARRIGIAGGRSKAVALEAVLHPGLFTHLVRHVAAAEVVVSGRS